MNSKKIDQDCRRTDIESQVLEAVKRNDLYSLHLMLEKHPFALECIDEYANTPLLLACHRGYDRLVAHLLKSGADHKRINIFGQNALALATYSNDRKTCETILRATTFDGFNSIGILTPLCVAVLQHNIDLARIFLSLEAPGSSAYDCPSETIHGVCPIQLAQQTKDINMVKLLRPKHNKHLHRNASHGNVSR